MTIGIKKASAILGFLVAAVYASSVDGSFHFDDGHSIEGNLAIRSLSTIPSLWSDPSTSAFIPENRVYRPLVYTFYTFCWLMGGGETWPFHLMKMAMHFLIALALYLIWRTLWRQPGWLPLEGSTIHIPLFSRSMPLNADVSALLLASIFAVHTANSEIVNYISATTSMQATLFVVWGYVAYLKRRDALARGHKDWRGLAVALFLYFCAVASKEVGIVLVALVGLTELFLTEGGIAQRVKRAVAVAAPYAAMALLLAYWLYVMHPPSGNESRGVVSPLHYFITQWRQWLWYMRIWFWPWDLNADAASIVYSQSFLDPLVIQAAVGNLVILGVAWLNRARMPALLFGLLWFYITISPESSVVVLAEARNERRMYMSYVGFAGGTFTLLLWLGERFLLASQRARRLGWLYAAVMASLFVGTQTRNEVWEDDEKLWLDTVEKNPTSGRAMNNLALVYMSRAQFDKSVEYLEGCERHWSSYMYCPLNKGIALNALRKYNEAEDAFLKAYSLNPRSTHSNFHLAKFYDESRHNHEKAKKFYMAADAATGGRYPDAKIRVAAILAQEKKYDDAREQLKDALALDPVNQAALFELGKLELDASRARESADAYRKLVGVNRGHVGAWYNLGVALLAAGDHEGALDAFQRTVDLDPKSEQGLLNLAFAAEKLRKGELAVDAARRLAAVAPGNRAFRDRLLELQGKFGGGQ